jgi:RNA polymerase sigma factor (TIGR02999 family)
MRNEDAGHTLQPTVLVHEAFLRISQETSSLFNDEAHFKAVAAIVMRRVLIDHARSRSTAKRGGGRPLSLDRIEPVADDGGLSPDELLALDEALTLLGERSPRQARVVELRFFGGLGFEEIGRTLDVSSNTAKNDWRFARAWLQQSLDTRTDGR